MRRPGLGLVKAPMPPEPEDADVMEYGDEPDDRPPEEQMADEPQDDESPDMERFQQAVYEDRKRQDPNMSPEEFDAWDMNWRRRAKEDWGLDEQEVDAFMDSVWESEQETPEPQAQPMRGRP